MTTSTSIKELAELHEIIPGDLWYHGRNPERFRTERDVQEEICRQGWVTCDTETISLEEREVLGLGIATSQEDAFYWDATCANMSFPYRVMEMWDILKLKSGTSLL